nr:hypothetical protein Itr_chr07CG12120 [Ipomoea trifida]
MSSRVFGAMMTVTLLFSIPVLLCGIWHSNAVASDKQVTGIAVLILLLSFIGFIGWSCSLDKPIVIVSDDVLRSLNGGYFIYQRQATWIMSPYEEIWINQQSFFCYSCESCKAEMNKKWRKVTIFYIGYLCRLLGRRQFDDDHDPMKAMVETTRIKTTMPITCLSRKRPDAAAMDCHIPRSNTGIEGAPDYGFCHQTRT